MHPVLFEVFGMQIGAYGVCMVLGAAAAFLLVRVLSGKNYNDNIWMSFFICICGAFAGAFLFRPITKIPEVILNWSDYREMTIGVIMGNLFGEIVFYGGLLGGAAALLIFCRSYKIPLLPLTDIGAPALALGHAFGRVGCYFGGCCYGVEVHAGHPLAAVYPPESLGAPPGIPLLAVPLIEAVCLLVIAAILTVTYKMTDKAAGKTETGGSRTGERRTVNPGLCTGLYFCLYAILRFVLEFFRGDIVRGVYNGISTSQVVSIGIFLLGIVVLYYSLFKRKKEKLYG